MKNYHRLLLILALLFVCGALPAHAEILTAPMAEDGDELDPASLKDDRQEAWDFWRETMLADETLKEETENKAMTFGDATMRYTVEVFGEMPEGGYPLYIAMHGGGSGDTPDLNDSQWEDMQSYYTGGLDCGVYVAVRGVRDTWDTHFNPESYPLYDRLIEYMILTENVNPNRVYLTGFSAGGDGIAQGTAGNRYGQQGRRSGKNEGANRVHADRQVFVSFTNIHFFPEDAQLLARLAYICHR